MLTVLLPEAVRCADAVKDMLAIRLSSVGWSRAPPLPAVQMLNAHQLEDLLFANVGPDIPETRTQTACLTRAPAALAVRAPSVRTTVVPPSANVHPPMLEIPTSPADLTPAVVTLVDLTPSAREAVKEHFVNVVVDILVALTAGLDAEPTRVRREFVEPAQSARMLAVDLFASVFLDSRATLTLDASKVNVTRTLTADLDELAKITSVLTLVPSAAEQERTAQCRTTSPSVGARGEPLATPLGIAVASPERRSAPPADRTPTVRLALMTDLSVAASPPTSETHCQDAVMNVTQTVTVLNLSPVIELLTDVPRLALMGPVERTLTAVP